MSEFRKEEKAVAGTCCCILEMVGPGAQEVLIIHGIQTSGLCSDKQGLMCTRETTDTHVWGDLISNSFHAVKHSGPRGSDGMI